MQGAWRSGWLLVAWHRLFACSLVFPPIVPTHYDALNVFSPAGQFNCYGGQGAKDMEKPAGTAAGNTTLQACFDTCTGTDGCTAVVVEQFALDPSSTAGKYHNETFSCFRRQDVDTHQCLPDPQYEVRATSPFVFS